MSITATGNSTNDSTEPQVIAALTPSDFERLYIESKAENDRLKTTMTAARLDPNPTYNRDAQPAKTAKQILAELGQHRLNQMTEQQQLATLGIDDPTVNRELLTKIFGRGSDPRVGKDLMLTSPGRYRLLKQGAILIRAFCA